MKRPKFTNTRTARPFSLPIGLLASLLICLTFIAPDVTAQKAQLSLADILIGLRSNKATLAERNEILAGAVKDRGITFELTPQIEKELESTGADQSLVDAIKQKSVIVKVAAAPQPKPTLTPVEPDSAFYKKQGDDYIANGDVDSALANYGKSIELNPKNTSTYLSRAVIYYNKKDFEMAVADYNKVIEANPKELIAYSNRANAYERMGNVDKAIADYKKILELDSGNQSATNNLIRIEDDKANSLQKQKEQQVSLAQSETKKEAPKATQNSGGEAKSTPAQDLEAPQIVNLGRINSSMAVNMVTPVYSQVAKSLNLQGEIKVEVIIDEKGSVLSADTSEGHRLLRDAAEQAARKSKFKPAMFGDKPVKAMGYIVYNFVR